MGAIYWISFWFCGCLIVICARTTTWMLASVALWSASAKVCSILLRLFGRPAFLDDFRHYTSDWKCALSCHLIGEVGMMETDWQNCVLCLELWRNKSKSASNRVQFSSAAGLFLSACAMIAAWEWDMPIAAFLCLVWCVYWVCCISVAFDLISAVYVWTWLINVYLQTNK
jgi:hypothetical protein